MPTREPALRLPPPKPPEVMSFRPYWCGRRRINLRRRCHIAVLPRPGDWKSCDLAECPSYQSGRSGFGNQIHRLRPELHHRVVHRDPGAHHRPGRFERVVLRDDHHKVLVYHVVLGVAPQRVPLWREGLRSCGSTLTQKWSGFAIFGGDATPPMGRWQIDVLSSGNNCDLLEFPEKMRKEKNILHGPSRCRCPWRRKSRPTFCTSAPPRCCTSSSRDSCPPGSRPRLASPP
jgi:hypothetical protein